jgi:hypothetical protein
VISGIRRGRLIVCAPTAPETEYASQPIVPSRLIAKEEQRREAEEAMAGYLAQEEATRQRTEHLRAARLAKTKQEKNVSEDKGEPPVLCRIQEPN